MPTKPTALRTSRIRPTSFPLPKGEGQGEGEETVRQRSQHRNLAQVSRLLRKRDTWAERLMWTWLRDRRFSDYKFRRQHQFGPHILDFFCLEAKLDIELDGSQHGFPEQRRHDKDRDAWLEQRGIKVLRFWNSNLRREKDVIRETIWQTLQERAPHPLPNYCLGNLATGDEVRSVSPHPGPLPWGEGESSAAIVSEEPASSSRTPNF